MNIFALDKNPKIAAQYHCDKHVVKMITESAQLLSTAAHEFYPKLFDPNIMYKPTHPYHPCTKWLGESLFNYTWLRYLLKHLIEEYEYRYNKPDKFTRAKEILSYISRQLNADFRGLHITPFALAMPDEFKQENQILAYRNYYKIDKKHLHKWTNRPTPTWVNE